MNFHSKTRNLYAYISAVLETLASASLSGTHSGQTAAVETAHHNILLGAVLHSRHLEDLSRATRYFLTPGQVHEVVECIVEVLLKAYENFNSPDVDMVVDRSMEHTHGKPKGGHRPITRVDSEAVFAMRYSLLARITATLLPSLPFSTLSSAMSGPIKATISSFADGQLLRVLQTPLDLLQWGKQIILSSTMHIQHSLMTSAHLRSLCQYQNKARADIFDSGKRNNILPELVLEAVRSICCIKRAHPHLP